MSRHNLGRGELYFTVRLLNHRLPIVLAISDRGLIGNLKYVERGSAICQPNLMHETIQTVFQVEFGE
jgi:hypothetical protein